MDLQSSRRDLICTTVAGASVIEKPTYLRMVWAFEVTRVVDGTNLRHQVSVGKMLSQPRRWWADVDRWDANTGHGQGATPMEAVRAAALEYGRAHPDRGPIAVEGLLDALEQAGAWLVSDLVLA
jgi:hypothetical protein